MTAAPLIVFDIGSTLVTGPAHGPARRIALRVGLDAAQKSALHQVLMTVNFAGPTDVASFVRDEFGIAGSAATNAIADIWTAQLGEAVPVVGSAETLAALAAANYQFAIVSNIWPPFLAAARRHFDWFIDDLVPHDRRMFSFQEGVKKPAQELFTRVLAAAGVPADQALMVGDSYRHDIAPAVAIGMRTVWLLHEPVMESASVIRVINRQTPGPSLALGSIAELDVTTVEGLFIGHTGAFVGTATEEKR